MKKKYMKSKRKQSGIRLETKAEDLSENLVSAILMNMLSGPLVLEICFSWD